MSVRIPLSFEEIVDEIVRFTDLPQSEVKHRVWMEALGAGTNVHQDVVQFGITPHKYDDKLEQLYREGDGFIFETLVHWAKPDRQRWAEDALTRIQLYMAKTDRKPKELSILLLGDGTGNDSLYLTMHGLHVDYFEVPGSKTYDFAIKRFEHYGVLGKQITVLDDYRICLSRRYDVVISFEVLEHLPDPLTAIKDLNLMLHIGGIALVTEEFVNVVPWLPTHLKSNLKYAGRTPFLFLKHAMLLSWYSRQTLFKPMEFTKVGQTSIRDLVSLFMDTSITSRYFLSALLGRTRRVIGNKLG